MVYVLDNTNNTKYFVSNEMSIEEFAMNIISEMRLKTPNLWVNANFGSDNIHIKAQDIKFDMWIYNKNHPVYQNAKLRGQ